MSGTSPADDFIELLRRRRYVPGALVVDLTGGDVVLAGALRGAGLVPLGVAADRAASERLASMGAEAVGGDLAKPDAVFEDLVVLLGERHVAAVWIGDIASLAAEPVDLVRAAHWFAEQTGAALGLHAPAHRHGHAPESSGSGDALRSRMAALGWAEVDREGLVRLYDAVMPVHAESDRPGHGAGDR